MARWRAGEAGWGARLETVLKTGWAFRPWLGQARVGGRGSGFFDVAPARRPDECNARPGIH